MHMAIDNALMLETVLTLSNLSAKYKCEYDGWESFVCK
jgi:hypothetical protein